MSDREKSKKKDQDANVEELGRLAFVLCVVALLLSALIPTVLGILIFWLFNRLHLAHRLSPASPRRFYVILLVATTATSIYSFTNGEVLRYFQWLIGIFGLSEIQWYQPPLLALPSYTLFITALIGSLGTEWLRSHAPEKIRSAIPSLNTEEAILVDPDQAARVAASTLAAPPLDDSADRTVVSGGDASHPDSERITIGIDSRRRPVHLHTGDMGSHGIVLGTTGTGKTVTLEALIRGMLDRGYSGCVLDLKEDIGVGGLADFLESYAAANTVEYQHWALSYAEEDFIFYLDPMFGLNRDLAANMITSMQDFEAPHWEAMCKQILGQLLHLMYTAHDIAPDKFPIPNLRDVGRILSGDLHDDTQAMRAVVFQHLKDLGQFEEGDWTTLNKPSPEHRQASKGLGARISAAYESHAGRTGLRAGGGRKPIRLADRGLVYIGLDSLGQPDTSRVVSSAILAGYSALASSRKDDPRVAAKEDRRFLVIDEAAAVNTTMVKNLLSRARSAGISIILATQGAVDWGDDWPAMVNNTNFSIIMGQQDMVSAQLAAELIGREVRTDESVSLSEGEIVRTNIRDVEDFRVPPENLRALPRGQAFVRVRDRFGSNVPYLTWVAIQRPSQMQTAPGHLTSAERRYKKASDVPFSRALPVYDDSFEQLNIPDSPLAAPPVDTPQTGQPTVPMPFAHPTPPSSDQGTPRLPAPRQQQPGRHAADPSDTSELFRPPARRKPVEPNPDDLDEELARGGWNAI